MLPKNEFTYEFGTAVPGMSDEDYNSRVRDFLGECTLTEDDEVTNQDETNKDYSFKFDNQPDLVQSCLQKVNTDLESKSKK